MYTQINIVYIEIVINADKQYPHSSILMLCVLLLALNWFVQEFFRTLTCYLDLTVADDLILNITSPPD